MLRDSNEETGHITTEDEVAKLRKGLLDDAESLGNVSEACRRFGLSRSRFYIYRRRFEEHGIKGLENCPPVHRHHPFSKTPEEVKELLDLSGQHPLWGCDKLSAVLKEERGVMMSSPVVQKCLVSHDLGRQWQRLRLFEENVLDPDTKVTKDQEKPAGKANPRLLERKEKEPRPGELLCQSTVLVGTVEGMGKIYAQAVVDTSCCYAFAWLHTGRTAGNAVRGVEEFVIPWYRECGIEISTILTHRGTQYSGLKNRHPYMRCLADNDIGHDLITGFFRTNHGFIESFKRTLVSESGPDFRIDASTTIERLQADLDSWMDQYNHQMPVDGYPNFGNPPATVLERLLEEDLKGAPES